MTSCAQFNRRHHCRRCGRLVCSSCSTKKMEIEACNKNLSRVCDQCYSYYNRENVPGSVQNTSRYVLLSWFSSVFSRVQEWNERDINLWIYLDDVTSAIWPPGVGIFRFGRCGNVPHASLFFSRWIKHWRARQQIL